MKILEEIRNYMVPQVCFIDEGLRRKQELRYSCDGDCCFDIPSAERIIIDPQERKLVKTNLKINLKKFTELQIRSRSGLAGKKGIFVLNQPGTIDEGYKGEIKVILANFSEDPFIIEIGDRIAQGKVALSFSPDLEIIPHIQYLARNQEEVKEMKMVLDIQEFNMIKDNIDEYTLTDALESLKLVNTLERSQGLTKELKEAKVKLEKRIKELEDCQLSFFDNSQKRRRGGEPL